MPVVWSSGCTPGEDKRVLSLSVHRQCVRDSRDKARLRYDTALRGQQREGYAGQWPQVAHLGSYASGLILRGPVFP